MSNTASVVDRSRAAAEQCGFGNCNSTIDNFRTDGEARLLAVQRTLAQFSKQLACGCVMYIRVIEEMKDDAPPQIQVLVGSGETILPPGEIPTEAQLEMEEEMKAFLEAYKALAPVASA